MLLIRNGRQVARACSQYLSAGSCCGIRTKSVSLFPERFRSWALKAYLIAGPDNCKERKGEPALPKLLLINCCTPAPALQKMWGWGSSAVERQEAKAGAGVKAAEVLVWYRSALQHCLGTCIGSLLWQRWKLMSQQSSTAKCLRFISCCGNYGPIYFSSSCRPTLNFQRKGWGNLEIVD